VGRARARDRSRLEQTTFGHIPEAFFGRLEGAIPDYNTQVAYLPSLKATIVVIANTDISNANVLNPAPAVFQALARIISPNNIPTG
jgi:hypothetical protein